MQHQEANSSENLSSFNKIITEQKISNATKAVLNINKICIVLNDL
jgi:hypothetical protein